MLSPNNRKNNNYERTFTGVGAANTKREKKMSKGTCSAAARFSSSLLKGLLREKRDFFRLLHSSEGSEKRGRFDLSYSSTIVLFDVIFVVTLFSGFRKRSAENYSQSMCSSTTKES